MHPRAVTWLTLTIVLLTLGAWEARSAHKATAAPQQCARATPAPPAVTSFSPTPPPSAAPTQGALPTEENAPGDIPDTQAFVPYTSVEGGYTILMPEGWARRDDGPNVQFSDKLHTFSVDVRCANSPPTVNSVTSSEVPALAKQVPAFELIEIKAIDLPAGPAILIRYRANSVPDEVTGKQHRLDVDRYEFFKDGRLVAVSLAVPAGSDNADVSNLIARSFQWVS